MFADDWGQVMILGVMETARCAPTECSGRSGGVERVGRFERMDGRGGWRTPLSSCLLAIALACASLTGAAQSAEQWITLATGERYRGEVVDGVPNGRGVLESADGRVLEGFFEDGRMQGESEINWPDGSRYRGPVLDGEPHGLGTWRGADRARYTGEYVNGVRHGWGEFRAADGSRYVGGYESGRRSGQGTIIDSDGTLFRGGFRGDRMHGYGVRVSPRGRSLALERWDDGVRRGNQQISESSDCRLRQGTRRWMVVSSRCVDGLAHGTGHAVSTDGTLLIEPGRFVLGQLATGSETALGQPPETTR